jgi:ABC-2 type transport system permease protein
MASWLQWIAALNPLTYAIEPIRYLYFNGDWSLGSVVMAAPWGEMNFAVTLAVLLGFDAIALLLIQPLLRHRFA